jgi:CHAD domain-containing protein
MALLQKARAKREKKLLRAFQNEVDDGFPKGLKRTSAHLQQETAKPAHRQAAEDRFLAAALDKFATVVKQHPALSEANLHAFRMDCKRARYLAEMAGDGTQVATVIEQLKRIQDSIGIWHDWLTLTATAESVLARSGQVPLLSALRTNTRSKYLEALRITADAKRALLEMHEWQQKAGKPVPRAAPVAATPAARAATA